MVSTLASAPPVKVTDKKRRWIWVLICVVVLLIASAGVAYFVLKAESVDKAFLRDFEKGIVARNEGAEKGLDADILVDQEWSRLGKYQDLEFEDKVLEEIAQTYLVGLKGQKDHLIHDESVEGNCYYDSDLAFYDSMIVRCSSIKQLHDSYGVLSKHEELVRSYTSDYFYWSELSEAEQSLENQLLGKTLQYDNRTDTYYLFYRNTTSSKLDLTIHILYDWQIWLKNREEDTHLAVGPREGDYIYFNNLPTLGKGDIKLTWDINLPDYTIDQEIRGRV